MTVQICENFWVTQQFLENVESGSDIEESEQANNEEESKEETEASSEESELEDSKKSAEDVKKETGMVIIMTILKIFIISRLGCENHII